MATQKDVRMAFEKEGIVLPLDKIFPRKQLRNGVKSTPRYQRIVSSIKVVGIVEPLLVFPQDKHRGEYILLDGHVRLEALKDLGESETFCLIATDDEAFTYNHHVCLMTAIQVRRGLRTTSPRLRETASFRFPTQRPRQRHRQSNSDAHNNPLR